MTIFRALAASVRSLPDRLPQTSGRSSGLSSMGGLLGSGGQNGMQAYKDVGAAYGPIRRICESVALTDWALYQQTESAGKIDRVLVDDATAPARHAGTALWTQPNAFMTRRVFLYLSQLWQETSGGCYWLICQGGKDGSPFLQQGIRADIELWPIRQDRITPIADPDQYLSGYVYRLGAEQIPLPVQAVVPLGWPDPLDPLQFAGPLQSVGTDLEAEKYASQYNRNVFINSARPGGVIEFDTPLTRDRWEEIVMRWREQHQGINNVARVAIIEQGKWVETSKSNTDMEYSKLRELGREEVMFALGMPFAMMQSNNVNLANATMGEKIFFRWSLRPRLENIKEPLNLRVLPYIGPLLTMDYDLPAPEDESFDVFAGTSGWLSALLTKNEGRAALGYDAIDNGDIYITDLPGVAPKPPAVMPARPPRRPTNLSYRAKGHESVAGDVAIMTDAWAQRLEQVRRSYLDLVASRNGNGH
jgi:phage portal protein BeeE